MTATVTPAEGVEKRCAVRYRDYVTESARSVTKSRLDRILDSAADLLVRWGYQRVTVEDVAKQAGIGKGTVYLHFRTKESLFLAVLLRVQQAVGAGMVERMRADPRHALPSRMISAVYRALAEDPVTHRIYFGDADTLGRQEGSACCGPEAVQDLADPAVRPADWPLRGELVSLVDRFRKELDTEQPRRRRRRRRAPRFPRRPPPRDSLRRLRPARLVRPRF